MKKILFKFLIICVAMCSALYVFTACSESPISFKVNFIVDEEIVKTIDTAGNEKIALPENPTKDGYDFDGWFWDKDTWEKPFTANSLLDAPLSSDMNVYAKFTKKHEHNYITVITAPTCAEKGYTTYTCECGNTYIDDYTDAFGHTPENAVEENGTEPKCEVKGGYDLVVYCKTCGAELSREHKEIAALTHEFTDYVSDNNATYDADGTKTAYCNHGCGATNKIMDVGTKLQSGIVFKTLTVDGNNVYGKIPNAQTEFDFLTEIEKKGNVSFNVSKNLAGDDIIVSKTAEPIIGDNKYYILVYQNGELLSKYNVTIRRRPIYTVTFNTDGGTAVESQQVEEDSFATEPTTTRAGYTLTGWDYIFDNPITVNTVITASWTANTDTKYKVEYYLQNLADDNYTLDLTDNLTGETDKQASAEIKAYNHFTYNANKSIVSENINGNGTTVLKVYYTRNKYTIKLVAGANVTLNRSYNGSYKYGYQIEEIAATFNEGYLGYEWKGWHNGDNVLTYDKTLSAFTVKKDLNYTADFSVKAEMQNFNFNSTKSKCTILSLKNKNLTEIFIPSYITSIGDYAFSDCKDLSEITIPDSVKSIGEYAFNNCSSLKSITIPDGVTYIGDSAFYNCSSLKSIYYMGTASEWASKIDGLSNIMSSSRTLYINNETLTNVVLENITEIKPYAFYNCSSLTSITIPDGVTYIGGSAFYECSSLTSITIPDSVTIIGNYAFSNCSSLTSITIPDGVTYIGDSAFYECSSLTSITIPDSVTSIGGSAFSGCSSLQEITIPFVGESKKVESDTYQYPFGYIFGTSSYTGGTETKQYYYGSSTSSRTSTTYYIPTSLKKVTVTGGNIRYGAFYNCSSLTSITIPDGVKSIGSSAFSYCSSLTSIMMPDSVTSIGEWAFEFCRSLTSITIPDSVTSIGKSAFYECSSLTSITIPDSVTSIGGNAFRGCSSITSVTIGNSVTSIGEGAFYECSSLTSITIPDSVTSIGGVAFQYCSSLTSVTIGNSVTRIGEGAFRGCPIESAKIPAIACSYVTNDKLKTVNITSGQDIEMYAFEACSSLTSITIPNSVTYIGWYAFSGCSSLTSVTFGENSKLESIWDRAFYNCSSLTSITIPDSVTSIGEWAFSGCSSLVYNEYENGLYLGNKDNPYVVLIKAKTKDITTFTINDNTKVIYSGAFYECSSLTSITIPDSVTSIGSYAFSICSGLTSVTFKNTSGWKISQISNTGKERLLSSSDLNTSTSATCLTSTYCPFYWKRYD